MLFSRRCANEEQARLLAGYAADDMRRCGWSLKTTSLLRLMACTDLSPSKIMRIDVSDHSAIEWTDATWNPVTGCTKVSPGCAHCYIERTPAFRHRPPSLRQGHDSTATARESPRPTAPWRAPRRVFVNSLSDLFHEAVAGGVHCARLRDNGTRALASVPDPHEAQRAAPRARADAALAGECLAGRVGRERAHLARIDDLRAVPRPCASSRSSRCSGPLPDLPLAGIHWVIVGGESGPGSASRRSGVGARHSRPVPGGRRAVLLQAVGRPRREIWRAAPRRAYVGRDARWRYDLSSARRPSVTRQRRTASARATIAVSGRSTN